MIDLFKNWLRGSINWEEEKRLRKMAETDTFLADALEGYDELPSINHAEKLTTLQQRLQKEHKYANPKIRIIPHWGRAIAASLALVLSMGLFFLVQNQMQEQSAIISDNSFQKTASPAPTMHESIAAYDGKSKPLILDTKESTQIEPSIVLSTAQDKIASQQTIRQDKTTVKQTPSKSFNPPPTQDTYANNSAVAVERKESSNLKKIEPKSIEIVAEDIAEIPLPTKRTSRIEEATEEEAEIASNIITATYIAEDQREDQSVAKERRTSDKVILSRAIPNTVLENQQAEPIGGFALFNSYIEQNLTMPPTTTDSISQGSVLLSFTILPTGEITNILVIKGLSLAYNQEAIRLLKEGPKWVANGSSLATYEVVFK